MTIAVARRGLGAFLAFALVAAAAGCSSKSDGNADACAGRPVPLGVGGADQAVSAGMRVDLSGQASAAPGATLAYDWRLAARPAGSAATLSAPTEANTSFVADVAGSYVATLTVSDGCNRSEPDVVVVTAVGSVPPGACAPAPAPVANAGADRSVGVNEVVSLNGGGSTTSRAYGIFYRWTLETRPAGSAAQLGAATSAFPT